MRYLPFIGLLLAVALAPLPLGSNRPGPSAMLALWIGLMLMLWALVLWRDWTQMNVRPPFWRLPALAFGAAIAWALVQAAPWTPAFLHHWTWAEAEPILGAAGGGAISAAPLDTLSGVTRLLTYAGVFFLAMQYCRERAGAQRLIATVAVSAMVYAVYGLAVKFSGNHTILWFDKWAYPDSLTATFVNRNSFATYCGIALVVLVAGLLAEMRGVHAAHAPEEGDDGGRRLARLALALCGVLILLTALFLTQSRGGLAATLVGLGVVMLLHYGLPRRNRLHDEIAAAGGSRLWILPVAIAVAAVALISGGAVLDRLGEGSGMSGRTGIWERSLVALADAPLRGHGLGTFETVFYAYQDEPHVFAYAVDKAHNTYLELLVELGVPFGLLLIAVPAWICWRILRGAGRQLGGRYGVIALGSSATIGIHGLVDFSAQIPAVALVWIALLGAGFAQTLPAGVSAMNFVRAARPGEGDAPARQPSHPVPARHPRRAV